MSHESPTLRAWAASHALLWNPAGAHPVLEAREAADGV